MQRKCTRCQRPFTRQDFVKDESRGLEADRREAGLAGVHFFDYRCPACGQEDVFLDVFRLEGETEEAYQARKAKLEEGVRRVQAERLDIILRDRDTTRGGRA